MWCSWTRVSFPSLPPSHQSFCGRHRVTRLTHQPRRPWMSSQRATPSPGATPIWPSSQTSRVLHGREHRECCSLCEGVSIWSAEAWMLLRVVTGNTSAVMSTESCHCWPTWVSSSLQTWDQFDLSTALRRTRYRSFLNRMFMTLDKRVNESVLFVGALHCSGIRCGPLWGCPQPHVLCSQWQSGGTLLSGREGNQQGGASPAVTGPHLPLRGLW